MLLSFQYLHSRASVVIRSISTGNSFERDTTCLILELVAVEAGTDTCPRIGTDSWFHWQSVSHFRRFKMVAWGRSLSRLQVTIHIICTILPCAVDGEEWHALGIPISKPMGGGRTAAGLKQRDLRAALLLSFFAQGGWCCCWSFRAR